MVYPGVPHLTIHWVADSRIGCLSFTDERLLRRFVGAGRPFGIDKLVWCFDPFIAVLLPETKNWLVHADFKSNNEAALEEARKSVENRFREIHRLVLSKVD
jgi:hypothetical protein